MRALIAIPIYNEARHVRGVLNRVMKHAGNVLVVDDGSSDATPVILREYPIDVIRHAVNRGYGRSIRDSITWAASDGYDWLVTMDCDEQHEPDRIPEFLEAAERSGADIISGSRYYDVGGPGGYSRPAGFSAEPALNGAATMNGSIVPPRDRVRVNDEITKELNERFGGLLEAPLTDSFCGFKAYRVGAASKLALDVDGYAFPMQFWVQAFAAGLKIREIPVSLIYNDPNRTFGAALDDPSVRLAHYREVMHREIRRTAERLPCEAFADITARCWRR